MSLLPKNFLKKSGQLKRRPKSFCSRRCSAVFNNNIKSQQTRTIINCKNCDKPTSKLKAQVNKNRNSFCSRLCSRRYNSIYFPHKTNIKSRSKLEIFIQNNLIKCFPKLDLKFNDRKTLLLELDLYVPSLNFAVEFNGPAHYRPIYGSTALRKQEVFEKIHLNDVKKIRLCKENNINLKIFDVSRLNKYNEQYGRAYLSIIRQIINHKLKNKIAADCDPPLCAIPNNYASTVS